MRRIGSPIIRNGPSRAGAACRTSRASVNPDRRSLAGQVELCRFVGHPAGVAVDWMLADTLGLRRRQAPAGAPVYRIFVRNLVLPFRIGIYEHEAHRAQRVRINVDLVVEPPA